MAGRGELTDAAWARIERLLPRVDGRGRPLRDHRQVVTGALWRLRTGAPRRTPPTGSASQQMIICQTGPRDAGLP
ncbi:transposase [Streptomyces sp. NBC_01276]|uniref:transposase n=1 Tax=Streptomyces sp. NBC_01276 TaxID=2903808 RepID=UPI002F907B98